MQLNWSTFGDFINSWRRRTLGLREIRSGTWGGALVTRSRTPFSAMWSPSFVPRPDDWPPQAQVVGAFFAQPHTLTPAVTAMRGRCVQGAFFHMQEWKKRWDDGARHIDPNAAYDTFRLDEDGIHRLALPAAAQAQAHA